VAFAQRPGGPPGPTPEERERIRVTVGMTKDQQNQIEAIYADGRKQEDESRKKSGEVGKQLRVLYDSYNYDRKQASALRKEMCGFYHQRMAIHADTQERVRKVLTKDQFDKLTELDKAQFEKWRKDWEQKRGSFGGPPRGFGRPPGSGPNH